jgi:hypothetical protein
MKPKRDVLVAESQQSQDLLFVGSDQCQSDIADWNLNILLGQVCGGQPTRAMGNN